MATQTPIIDSQVHAYERDRPERPWSNSLPGPAEVTGDDMVAAMDAVGVAGALLVSPFTMYRYDASYALEIYAKHPGRVGLIKPFNPHSEAVADEIAEWAGTPGVVGARLMFTSRSREADDPGLNRIFAAGAKAGIPVNVLCWGKLALLRDLARRHPNTQIVVDHVGLSQPFKPPAPPEPFAELASVVSLAACDNVRDQDFRRVYPVPSALPLPGHLGAAGQDLRRVRFRPLHVGHRLDPSRGLVDLRARR